MSGVLVCDMTFAWNCLLNDINCCIFVGFGVSRVVVHSNVSDVALLGTLVTHCTNCSLGR